MRLQMHLTRPDPVYFAWKRAMNTTWDGMYKAGLSIDRVQELTQDAVEREWGCCTKHIHRKSGYVVSVDVEFESEAKRDWFVMRWAA